MQSISFSLIGIKDLLCKKKFTWFRQSYVTQVGISTDALSKQQNKIKLDLEFRI